MSRTTKPLSPGWHSPPLWGNHAGDERYMERDAVDSDTRCEVEPIITRPNGKSYVFMDELTDAERRYLMRMRQLTPEQWKQLEDFAAHLHAKHTAKTAARPSAEQAGA